MIRGSGSSGAGQAIRRLSIGGWIFSCEKSGCVGYFDRLFTPHTLPCFSLRWETGPLNFRPEPDFTHIPTPYSRHCHSLAKDKFTAQLNCQSSCFFFLVAKVRRWKEKAWAYFPNWRRQWGISVFLSLLVCCPLPFLRIKLGFVQSKALLFVLEKKNRI